MNAGVIRYWCLLYNLMRRVSANLWASKSLATVNRKFAKHRSVLKRLVQYLIFCIFIVIKVGLAQYTYTHTFKIETN